MRLPVELQAGVSFVVGAGSGVITSRSALAAAGVGWRYRIWGYSFGWWRSNGAGVAIGRIRDGGGVIFGTIVQSAGGPSAPLWIPGGFQLSDNTACIVIDENSVAGQNLVHSVYYTLERVP